MIGLFLILLFSGFVTIAVMHDKVKFWQQQALLWRERALMLERRLDYCTVKRPALDGQEHLERN